MTEKDLMIQDLRRENAELAEQLGLMTTICEFCAKQKNCEDAQDYNCCMEGIFKWLQQPAEEG